MALRIGPGPVFVYECITACRRWQMYAGRAVFVFLLLAALVFVALGEWRTLQRATTIQTMATVGVQFYYAIIGMQLSLVLLAAPAATAGAICMDRARGGLTHLLVTDLSNAEIILGKLFARLLPVSGLVLCGLPVLFMATLLGGIDTDALFGAFLVTVGVAIVTCSLALMLSIWGQKTHEVLLATYLILMLWLLVYPMWLVIDGTLGTATIPRWLIDTNPYWLAFAVYAAPGATSLVDHFLFLVGCIGIAVVFLGVSIVCLRRVVTRQASKVQRAQPVRRRRPLLPAPSIDRNPVLWREWHRRRPSRWSRAVWAVYFGGSCTFTLLAMAMSLAGRTRFELPPFVSAFEVSIGMLLVVIGAVSTLAEERVRGGLDLLMSTALPTSSIVWGKWWGTFRTVPLLAIFPALTAIVAGWADSSEGLYIGGIMLFLVLGYGVSTVSLGLACATWIKRFGWAMAAAVTIYLSVTVGWFMICVFLFSRAEELANFSAFFGPGNLTADSAYRGIEEGWKFVVPAACHVVIGVLVLWLTLLTFDQCMGRITLRRRPSPRHRLRIPTGETAHDSTRGAPAGSTTL